jgi:hypothetical protein
MHSSPHPEDIRKAKIQRAWLYLPIGIERMIWMVRPNVEFWQKCADVLVGQVQKL